MSLTMTSIENLESKYKGIVGERLLANEKQWLLVAPYANPGMLERLRMREYGYDDDMVVWYGEFVGKHLTASALAWKISRSAALRKMITDIVGELERIQDDTGYLGPYGKNRRFLGTEERRIWDVWGHYHIMLGLLLWHEASGDRKSLEICLKAADCVCSFFLDGGRSILDAGCSEMNTSVAHVMGLLYRKTNNVRYLEMMRHIEKSWDDPQGGGYITDTLNGKEFYELRKPRWESLHAIQGILQLYHITGEDRYRDAFTKLWRSIDQYDVHNTGGFSSGEQACGNPFDPGAIETCCTVAWSVLSVDMLRLTGDPYVADRLELAFYNGVLGSQSPSGRWWTYNSPMDGVKEASAHSIVFQALAGSPELNCCSVNGPRALALLPDWAVMICGDSIAVNHYGPTEYCIGGDVRFNVQSDYPWGNHVRIAFDAPMRRRLCLRIPAWSAKTVASVNGKPFENIRPGCYFNAGSLWNTGDVVDIRFDFTPRVLAGARQCENKVSIYRGPILLAYDEAYNSGPVTGAPSVEPDKIAFHRAAKPSCTKYAKPMLLLRVDVGASGTIQLCDFASAGIAGSRYRSWLDMRKND